MKRTLPRGFTLLETLLALALVVILTSAVFVFMHQLGLRRSAAEGLSEQRQALAVTLMRISQDLSTAVAGVPGAGAGVIGDAGSLHVLARSTDLDGAIRGGPEGRVDLLACDYRFDPEAGVITASRRGVTGAALPEPRMERACAGVRRVRLRYCDAGRWLESFDSGAAGKLPTAVEIRVWIGSPTTEEARRGAAPDESLVVAIPDAAGGES